jgi:hypothetical protein
MSGKSHSLRQRFSRRNLVWLSLSGAACALVLVGAMSVFRERDASQATSIAPGNHPASFTELMKAVQSGGKPPDIARANLLCAEGLPGNETAAHESLMKQLDAWAKRVDEETRRHRYRFEQNPAEFKRSEGYFRILMLGVVLAEDFGVRYDPARQSSPDAANANDRFFAAADAVFLNGVLGDKRQGTCSSLPVLYVAIGRRLGYPLHLVTTKGHLFVRWDGQGERFNIEATGHGLNSFDDDYYRKWPLGITADEEQAEGHLRNLDPAGELALFLSIRGMCLKDNGRIPEAAEAFGRAAATVPECRSYRVMHNHLKAASATILGTQQSP